jgi:hypothetical protein
VRPLGAIRTGIYACTYMCICIYVCVFMHVFMHVCYLYRLLIHVTYIYIYTTCYNVLYIYVCVYIAPTGGQSGMCSGETQRGRARRHPR